MGTVGSMSIASGGLVTGWAAHTPDSDGTSPHNKNSRQTVCVLADGELIGRAVAQQAHAADPGYDSNHGYSFQLPSELLDGVTPHKIEVALQGGDGTFATQTGVLS
jgi:hypothetical protein